MDQRHGFHRSGGSSGGGSSGRMSNHGHSAPPPPQPPRKNYKLLVDPLLVEGANKVYRFEGVVENDPTYPTVHIRDPRKSKIWKRTETTDLPVPRFKIDDDYVGPPPSLEVTLYNINDNIDKQFLANEIVNKHQCGVIEDLQIFNHDLSRKHLGIARIVFEEPDSARLCVRKLNNQTLMGKVLQVFLDPFGEECKKRVSEIGTQLEEDAAREEEAKEAKKRPPPPPPSEPAPPVKPLPPKPKEDDHETSRERDLEKLERSRYEDERSSMYNQPPGGPPNSFYGDSRPPPHQQFQDGRGHFPPDGRGGTQYMDNPRQQQPGPYGFQQQQQQGFPPYDQYQQQQHGYQNYQGYPPQHQEFRGGGYNQSGHHWGGSNGPPGHSGPPGGGGGPGSGPSWSGGQHGPPPGAPHGHPPHGGHMMDHRAPVPPEPHHGPPASHPPWPGPGENRYHNTQHHHGNEYQQQGQHNSHNTSSYDKQTGLNSTHGSRSKLDDRLDGLSLNNKPTQGPEGDDSAGGLDLDTRIAMLLQSKDSAMAPLLNISLGSDEDEDKKDQQDSQDVTVKKESDSVSGNSNSNVPPPGSGPKSSGASSGSDTEATGSQSSTTNSDTDDGITKDSESFSNLEPLETPPSPFLSLEQYLYWHQKGQELKKEAHIKEQQENRERLKKLKKKKVKKKRKHRNAVKDVTEEGDNHMNGMDDDRMSLSSLSSTEDPILHQDVPIPAPGSNLPYGMPPPGYPPQYSGAVPPGYPQSYLPPGYPAPPTLPPTADPSYPHTHPHHHTHPQTHPHPHPPHPGPHQYQPTPTTGYPSNHLVAGYPGYNPGYMAYPPGYPINQPPSQGGVGNTGSAPPYPGYHYPPVGYQQHQPNEDETHKSGEYHDPTINAVLDTVIEELKKILRRDFNKRMIEATAFKTFEAWWEDQENKFKAKAKKEISSTVPRVEKLNNISSLLETSDNFGLDSSLGSVPGGLGIRMAMPRMPSFRKIKRKIIKAPTPPNDEDSRGIEDENDNTNQTKAASDSDSGPEDSVPTRRNKPSTVGTSVSKRIKPTWSSDDSDEASAESSDEDEKEEEEESSSSSSSSSSASEAAAASADEESEDELEELKELRRLQAEFDAHVASTVESVMRTPENSRSTTPIPDGFPDDEEAASASTWMDTDTTVQPEQQPQEALSSPKKASSPVKASKVPVTKTPKKAPGSNKKVKDAPTTTTTTTITPKKTAIKNDTPIKKDASKKSKDRRKTAQETAEQEKQKQMPLLETKLDQSTASETDTADEKSDLEDGDAAKVNPTEAAEALMALAGATVNGRERSTSSSSSSSSSSSAKSANSSTGDEQRSPVLMEHSYCLPWAPKDGKQASFLPPDVSMVKESKKSVSSGNDHDYSRPQTPPNKKNTKEKLTKGSNKFVSPKPRGKENRSLQNSKEMDYLDKKKMPVLPSSTRGFNNKTFNARNQMDEYNVLYSFLLKGIDHEDLELLKRSYERMLVDDSQSYWLNDTHWVDHPPTDIPQPARKKRKVDDLPLHKTGCARTEGIYKADTKHKQAHKFTSHQEIELLDVEAEKPQSLAERESSKVKLTHTAVSREVRSFQRRLLTAFGSETDSDLLKFNQLKFRKKLLRFGKSRIHDWGLFAMESIGTDEMVIEYVGQSIRSIIADLREGNYEKIGIGSSYMFRVDVEGIIDATKCGNLARFINHSCSPNCYAKIVTVDNCKKIVIYSKQAIACGEEITYDYKFPLEEEKITCLCGGATCKGTLN